MASDGMKRTDREERYVIGLDIGTSAVKGVLMSEGGSVVSREKEATRYRPAMDGLIQFHVDEWHESVTAVIRTLAGVLPSGWSVAAISIASASGNTVLVNERGEPMRPAISWMDERVREEMDEIFDDMASEVHERIGWPYMRLFPLAHLSWLKRHEPEALAGAARICLSTDYMLHRLTGKWGIDASTATTSYLQDQKAMQWHLPFVERLGISVDQLPPIYPVGSVLGGIAPSAAMDTTLRAGTPIVLGAFDHPCAARGSSIMKEGQLLLSCGTSWVGFFPTADRGKAVAGNLLVDPFLQPEGAWGAMFSLPAIATSIDKYICRYIADGPNRYREFDKLASAAAPGAGGLLIHPMAEEEFHDAGIYRKEQLARALMEGTAYLLLQQVEKLAAAGLSFTSVTMVGGPSETAPWPQIVADVLGREVVTVNGSCAGAVGAAIVAGIGAGLYRNEEEAHRKLVFPRLVRTPDEAAHKVYREQYRRFAGNYQEVWRS